MGPWGREKGTGCIQVHDAEDVQSGGVHFAHLSHGASGHVPDGEGRVLRGTGEQLPAGVEGQVERPVLLEIVERVLYNRPQSQ